MSQNFVKTKPSLMEAGLPCSSLSAECQRDNNARQRPPQNRLHIWWARRPPTVCRVGILSALLPHDFKIPDDLLPPALQEPSLTDLENLPDKFRQHRDFFQKLLSEVNPTTLTKTHRDLLRSLGIHADTDAAYRRIAESKNYLIGNKPIHLPAGWAYNHSPAFTVSPTSSLIEHLLHESRSLLRLPEDQPVVMLDFMAGGGAIPLEGIRHGLKVYANDLNPVAAIVEKATLEYPARHCTELVGKIAKYCQYVASGVETRLQSFFFRLAGDAWWPSTKSEALKHFDSKSIANHEAGGSERIQAMLWCRTVPCTRCALNIPLSTNFHIVTKKGKPAASVAAFPEVPTKEQGNDCTFKIVGVDEWKDCKWPSLGSDAWHPRNTPTFKGGHATCPRCAQVVDESIVKRTAQATPGGLPAQMYAVCSQVPVKLTYRDGSIKTRFMWRFRVPTEADIAAVRAAEKELTANEARWADLIPSENVPEIMEDKRPREYGMSRWRDFFLPRQLLVAVTVLDEVRKASQQAREELPPDEAEAVSVYLAFIVSKVVNYNSVNTFWHYGRKTVTQTFSRHDFAFRPAFCEFEGARETVMWGASQVIGAYTQIAGLIHGEHVTLGGGDDDSSDGVEDDETEQSEEIDSDLEDDSTIETKTSEGGAKHTIRPEVIVPVITNNDASQLETPAPGTVHLICVDPPYYNNIQYSELSNFFYVWLKRALHDFPGLEEFFREELAETNREAVANNVRWKADADKSLADWNTLYSAEYEKLANTKSENGKKLTISDRKKLAATAAGPKPLTAAERAEQFYESKMAAVFRRARILLHPAGRMVVMFNHKMTKAWRALGRALIEAGFDIKTSIPVHTEAESSLNVRGLDAARSTVLLLCIPREQTSQVTGNWDRVRRKVAEVARNAASQFQSQGIFGTDLYLSALGPALGEVGRHWPITNLRGDTLDLTEALEEAYGAVAKFRLDQILQEISNKAGDIDGEFTADTVDRNTQALWLWLDTFQGEVADSDDVRKLSKSLNIEPDAFKSMHLVKTESDIFTLKSPIAVDLNLLSRQLSGESIRGRNSRGGSDWTERKFANFVGAAVWNAISIMAGTDNQESGVEPLKKWMRESQYGSSTEFKGAYAVTLHLLQTAFDRRPDADEWKKCIVAAKRAWDLAIRDWRE